jgi:predicted transcriptional regulator
MSTSSQVAELLKYNMKRVDIAAELGLTPGAVTQAAARLAPTDEPLTPQHAELDSTYDSIESKLLKQLDKTIPLLMRPMEISRVLQTINAAKRRGGPLKNATAAPTVLQLNLPIAIQNRFVLNSNNQVISAGAQDLVTIPSSAVSRLAAESKTNHANTLSTTQAEGIFQELGFDASSS